jgi:predicted DNA-binding transcriptional regulator YafY
MPDEARPQIERILHMLPLATRPGGVTLAEAARILDVDVDTVLGDVEEVTAREFYHPPASAETLQISVERNTIKVFPSRMFERPAKLTCEQALALEIGLRVLALGRESDEAERLHVLADRLVSELAVRAEHTLGTHPGPKTFSLDDGDGTGASLRALFGDAVRSRRRCAFAYLKPGDERATERMIDPYAVVHGAGGWYVIGLCHASHEVRVFRLDRVLSACKVNGDTPAYAIPGGFDVDAYVADGHVFHFEGETGEVRVRYSARIAPWIRENGEVTELDDGSVAVDYPAADPGWAVRHALAYGAEAEIVEPRPIRGMVREVLREML